mmetsp:Transcript_95974/g.117614  ORF Transcript_95974/g.117614 Transcript_95974/m.117614 type:complete len:162 (-) Transcript_95974:56-541(-)
MSLLKDKKSQKLYFYQDDDIKTIKYFKTIKSDSQFGGFFNDKILNDMYNHLRLYDCTSFENICEDLNEDLYVIEGYIERVYPINKKSIINFMKNKLIQGNALKKEITNIVIPNNINNDTNNREKLRNELIHDINALLFEFGKIFDKKECHLALKKLEEQLN